ncbi:MAG: ATP synthase F0 subunit B [Desulfobulbaceae bacterium]|nr:ATP synthase F0 subunit B [Desulfobulbaceae bacterium]HIJ79753.1 ATP synthase F0 subunit B [Deltaproteobacteria bacterium]
MITIDLTMPLQIVNMLLLIVILNAVLYKPIRGILAERQKKIAGLGEGISNFTKNAELRLGEFEQKLKAARIKAKGEYEAARNEALSASNEKLAAIRKEIDAEKASQLGEIEKQFVAAQTELKGQVDGFATEMAGKILGRAV